MTERQEEWPYRLAQARDMTPEQLEEWLPGFLARNPKRSPGIEHVLLSCRPPKVRGLSRNETIRQWKLIEEQELAEKWRVRQAREQWEVEERPKAAIHAEEAKRVRLSPPLSRTGRDIIETYKAAIRRVQEPHVASGEGPASKDVLLKVLRKTFGKMHAAAFRVAWKEAPKALRRRE